MDDSDVVTIYLEFPKKNFRAQARRLCKKQFWLKPIETPLAACILIVFDTKEALEKSSSVNLYTKIMLTADGILWKEKAIKEAMLMKAVVSESHPTPRVVIKFWRV